MVSKFNTRQIVHNILPKNLVTAHGGGICAVQPTDHEDLSNFLDAMMKRIERLEDALINYELLEAPLPEEECTSTTQE